MLGVTTTLVELVVGLDKAVLTRRHGDDWSIQENAGHLWDLELLWYCRVDDVMNNLQVMREADLTNQKTYDRDHNTSSISDLLLSFRQERMAFVARLGGFDEQDVVRTALHPRLLKPMRILDLAFFVAEHDDHHLAQIMRLKRRFAG